MRPEFKAKIDYRDQRRCAICGAGEPDTHIGRHHIHPRRYRGPDHITNVITLCKRHHEQADIGLIPPADLFSIVEERNADLHWNEGKHREQPRQRKAVYVRRARRNTGLRS